MLERVHIMGGAGAGVSTLGRALAGRLAAKQVDVDDYVWAPSDPPFTSKRPLDEVIQLIATELARSQRWVLSGSVTHWGDELLRNADLVVFVDTRAELRLARVIARERTRFGDLIAPGGPMRTQHDKFLAWVRAYEDSTMLGRNRRDHEVWLSRLASSWLRIDGSLALDAQVDLVISRGVALEASRGPSDEQLR